jgi:hypothetical protein
LLSVPVSRTGASRVSSTFSNKHYAIMLGIHFYLTKNNPLIPKSCFNALETSSGTLNLT